MQLKKSTQPKSLTRGNPTASAYPGKNWVWTALIFLLITAFLGAFLRFFYVFPLELNYKNFLHGHSHVAFLGWIFNALYVLIVSAFLSGIENKKFYSRLFWAFQVTVLGMLILFPMQGYDTASIIVSTLHILLSFIFAWAFLRNKQENNLPGGKHRLSYVVVRFAIILMIISAIGPFALGPIMANDMKSTIWYNLAIYFYLHFQYNGWFLFATIGLLFYFLEANQISFSHRDAKSFYRLNAIAVIPAFLVSALWTKPPQWIYTVAAGAALLQIISLFYLIRLLLSIKNQLLQKLSKKIHLMMGFVVISLIIKNILQFLGTFPGLADLAFRSKNLVIAYLHLNFIGIFTFFLLGAFVQKSWIQLNTKLSTFGIWIFFTGFVLNELFLVVQSLLSMSGIVGLSDDYLLLFFISLLMPIGLTMSVIGEIMSGTTSSDQKSFF